MNSIPLNNKRSFPANFEIHQPFLNTPNKKIRKLNSLISSNNENTSFLFDSPQSPGTTKQKKCTKQINKNPHLEKPVYPLAVRKFLNSKFRMNINDVIRQLEVPSDKLHNKKLKQMRFLRNLQEKEIQEQVTLRQRYTLKETHHSFNRSSNDESLINIISPITEFEENSFKSSIFQEVSFDIEEEFQLSADQSNHSETNESRSNMALDFNQILRETKISDEKEELNIQNQNEFISFNEIDYSTLQSTTNLSDLITQRLDAGADQAKENQEAIKNENQYPLQGISLGYENKIHQLSDPFNFHPNYEQQDIKQVNFPQSEFSNFLSKEFIVEEQLKHKSLANHQLGLISTLLQSKNNSSEPLIKAIPTDLASLPAMCNSNYMQSKNMNQNLKVLEHRLALLKNVQFNNSTNLIPQKSHCQHIQFENQQKGVIETCDNFPRIQSSLKEPSLFQKLSSTFLPPEIIVKNNIDEFFSIGSEGDSPLGLFMEKVGTQTNFNNSIPPQDVW